MKQVSIKNPFRFAALLVSIFLSVGAFAQITVKGHVNDDTGEPVIGATVRVEGAQGGAVTDFDGNFTIKAQQGATLNITYVGYQPAQVKAAPSVLVVLKSDAQVLENVVVIGYGRAKKEDLTGSVTAMKPDDMNKGLQTSPQDMIQGKIAGVNVQTGGGEPGGSATIRIRGGSSLNASNDPLIVIDGMAVDNYGMQGMSNPLNLVNPNDIESFTVLKDASATAIYGSRASNGVIIITTKKGRKNSRPTITYNGNVSVSAVKNKLDVLNGEEFVQFVKNASGLDGAEWEASDYYKNLGYTNADGQKVFADTDWQDEIYQTAVSTDHNITLAGGFKNLPYRVSLGYTKQEGVVKTSDYERYTASINLNPTLLDDHLTINFNAKGMYAETSYAQTGAMGEALDMDPTKPVYMNTDFYNQNFGGYFQFSQAVDRKDFDNTWQYGINTLGVHNPVATLNTATDHGRSRELLGNIELDYKIHGFEDLHLHMNMGMDLKSGKSNKWYSRYNYDNYYYGSQGWNTQDTYNLSFNAYAQYLKDFAKVHHIDVMAGYEWQHFHQKTDYYYYGTYPETAINGLAGTIYNPSENTLYKTENFLVSFFGRLNYSLKDRYLLTFTLRDDGSSRFAKGNRWGLFPSLALAWKMKEETFLKNIEVLSDAKLRLGWGKTGQQEGIGDYGYFESFTTNRIGAYYPIIGDGITYRPDALNPDLTWEKTTTYNAGIDLGFFDNRLTASIDYYYRKTTDLINTVTVPAGSNFRNRVTSNIGELHNTGVEFSLNYRAIQTRDWFWEIGFNATHNKNEIDMLVASNDPNYKIPHGGLAVGDAGSDGIQAWSVGQAVSAFYVFQQVYDENGLPIEGEFVDRDGNGVINNDDRYFYKKADPDVQMGLTSKLTYKNWDFSFSLRASLGNYVYNAVEVSRSDISLTRLSQGGTWHNVAEFALEKNWQQVTTTDALSDYFIQNASFLKCDNITVGYSFDKIMNLPISGRIYATAQNVFTITKYKGIDPEINGGYDGSIYPRPFVGILGLNLNF